MASLLALCHDHTSWRTLAAALLDTGMRASLDSSFQQVSSSKRHCLWCSETWRHQIPMRPLQQVHRFVPFSWIIAATPQQAVSRLVLTYLCSKLETRTVWAVPLPVAYMAPCHGDCHCPNLLITANHHVFWQLRSTAPCCGARIWTSGTAAGFLVLLIHMCERDTKCNWVCIGILPTSCKKA